MKPKYLTFMAILGLFIAGFLVDRLFPHQAGTDEVIIRYKLDPAGFLHMTSIANGTQRTIRTTDKGIEVVQ